MVKHREHIPLILALSLGIGLIPDLFHALTYSRITSLTAVLLPGVVIGSLLSYGAITWIQRHQSKGVLHLRIGATLVIVAYLAVVYVIPLSNVVANSAAFCSMILAGDAIDCGYKFFVLQSTADFVLWAGLYVLGLRFEHRSRQRLIYKLPLGESGRAA
jgi:hypothetical protein